MQFSGYAGVLKCKGDCLVLMGKNDEALQHYKDAIDAAESQSLHVLKVLSFFSLFFFFFLQHFLNILNIFIWYISTINLTVFN